MTDLIERLQTYAATLLALRRGVPAEASDKLATVNPELAARAMTEAADEIIRYREALEELVAAVERTPKHLRMPIEVEAAERARQCLGS